MQGWRITMEDAHAAVLTLKEGTKEKNSFFGVYDGHGGSTVAKFAGKNVHKRLLAEEAYRKKRYDEAMKRAFLGTDEDLLADPAHTRDPSGCTAVAALLTHDNKIYVANAGDSRSVISVKGEVKPLSYDHKPSNDTERARIVGAGGYIEFGRVNGNLALSRALGDFEFKKNYSLIPQKQAITSDPDVTVHEITNEDEFLVLACDGIWDCLTSQQVVDVIRLKISEGKELSEIGEAICEHCLAPDTSSGTGIGCDNMTVLIVAILNGKTKQEWYDWITDRVKTGYGFRTPDTIPQIYSSARLMAYKARREAQDERERLRSQRGDDLNAPPALFGSTAFSGFARVLGSTGGISFNPTTGIMTDGGTRLMFATADDEEDDDMETETARSFFGDFGLGRSVDPAASLRDRLAAYEKDMKDGVDDELGESGSRLVEIDDEDVDGPFSQINGDVPKPPLDSVSHAEEQSVSSEAPSVPQPKLNGGVLPVPQLQSQPLGDEPDPVIKAEGLMDTSEDPLVA
ncbi:PP2C-domain-containing protein [Boletus edulis]|uniref:protein-serine/threonine phosphatase n=1 Tax=Boletus edulis BED1 TaxID=1328754 RepID=A0AAD4BYX1_BOLED|nr:PP2C-domain-containing protein [Boletus edulis]KAF8442914.1 PP2C-domain-containing protein [Boletus edulis BED1]